MHSIKSQLRCTLFYSCTYQSSIIMEKQNSKKKKKSKIDFILARESIYVLWCCYNKIWLPTSSPLSGDIPGTPHMWLKVYSRCTSTKHTHANIKDTCSGWLHYYSRRRADKAPWLGCQLQMQLQHVWKTNKKGVSLWVCWELPWQGAEQAITSYCTI